MGEDIYSVYSQYMALDSFHAQIQISDSKCDMGQFPIFNKRWLSWTGDADICSYNSFPNSVPGWLVTSFNRAKCWETSLPFFHLIYNKNLLVHCFICVWMRFDSQSFFFYHMPVSSHVVCFLLPGSCLLHELLGRRNVWC